MNNTRGAGAGTSAIVYETVILSRLDSFEPDAGIDDGINYVRDDVAYEHKQAPDDENAKGDRVVALENRLIAEVAHSVDVEDFFYEERSGENQTKNTAETSCERNY